VAKIAASLIGAVVKVTGYPARAVFGDSLNSQKQ
jgi:hypothetical protein